MDERYEGREQSAAKHLMLSNYLEKLAYKVGFHRPGLTLNYIDGFAGPWESKSEDLSDTSPSLALCKLTEVRASLQKLGIAIKIRAFFVSPTRDGVAQLESLKKHFHDLEIVIAESRFEEALEAARQFSRGGSNPFTFIFIDHTGWTGFGLKEISPLLREGYNEVLINFMTGHITRFIDNVDSRYDKSFDDLFGDPSFRQQWRGLQGLDREDRIVEAYCQRVARAGRYKHCVASVILNPRRNRTHFHLIYGTRSDEGLVTFRGVEKDGLEFQRNERATVQQRERIRRSGQEELFGAGSPRTYEDELHDRYRAKLEAELDRLIRDGAPVSWDEIIRMALRIPMICEQEVKEWVKGRLSRGSIEVLGMKPREQMPKRKRNHRVRLLKSP